MTASGTADAHPPASDPGAGGDVCLACGACCGYSRSWPRFTLEDDETIARIPPTLVRADGNGMACDADRCRALAGRIGEGTRCSIHSVRPIVCRDCMPGDPECLMARERFGLPPLAEAATPARSR